MNRIFSGGVDFSRVNPWGIALLAAGVLIVAFADKIAKKFGSRELNKIIGLLVSAGGALLAILG